MFVLYSSNPECISFVSFYGMVICFGKVELISST